MEGRCKGETGDTDFGDEEGSPWRVWPGTAPQSGRRVCSAHWGGACCKARYHTTVGGKI